jgi:(1->4)-alpha-D-glucan 1-alpha-D-glucosylmutase
MLFEREYDGDFRAPAQYPAQTLASFNTHDWPSFRSRMEGHDLRVRKAIRARSAKATRRAQNPKPRCAKR